MGLGREAVASHLMPVTLALALTRTSSAAVNTIDHELTSTTMRRSGSTAVKIECFGRDCPPSDRRDRPVVESGPHSASRCRWSASNCDAMTSLTTATDRVALSPRERTIAGRSVTAGLNNAQRHTAEAIAASQAFWAHCSLLEEWTVHLVDHTQSLLRC